MDRYRVVKVFFVEDSDGDISTRRMMVVTLGRLDTFTSSFDDDLTFGLFPLFDQVARCTERNNVSKYGAH